jgi:hypothetical protein
MCWFEGYVGFRVGSVPERKCSSVSRGDSITRAILFIRRKEDAARLEIG